MSWFKEMYQYSMYSADRPRNEPFATAALSLLLDGDPQLQHSIWTEVFQTPPAAELSVLHQWIPKLGKGEVHERLDIVLIEKNEDASRKTLGETVTRVVVLEAKLGEAPDEDQLRRYKDSIDQEFPEANDRVVIALSKYESEYSWPGYIKWSWQGLGNRITELSGGGAAAHKIRQEFCEMLEEWNMIDEPAIQRRCFETIGAFDQLNHSLDALLRKVIEKLNGGTTDKFQFRGGSTWYRMATRTDANSSVSVFVLWSFPLGSWERYREELTPDIGVGIRDNNNRISWGEFEDDSPCQIHGSYWNNIPILFVSLQKLSKLVSGFFSMSLEEQAREISSKLEKPFKNLLKSQ